MQVGANTEDSQDSASADRAPEIPKQVLKEQITAYQVSEAPDEQVSQKLVTANQALEDQVSESTHLEHQVMEDDPDEHCTVPPSKAGNAIKNKEQHTDDIMHGVEKHPEEPIKHQKQSKEEVEHEEVVKTKTKDKAEDKTEKEAEGTAEDKAAVTDKTKAETPAKSRPPEKPVHRDKSEGTAEDKAVDKDKKEAEVIAKPRPPEKPVYNANLVVTAV